MIKLTQRSGKLLRQTTVSEHPHVGVMAYAADTARMAKILVGAGQSTVELVMTIGDARELIACLQRVCDQAESEPVKTYAVVVQERGE